MPRERKPKKYENELSEDVEVEIEIPETEDFDFSSMIDLPLEQEGRSLDVDLDKLIEQEEQKEVRVKENKKGDFTKNIVHDETPGEGEAGIRSKESRYNDENDPDGFLRAQEEGLIQDNPEAEFDNTPTLDINDFDELVIGNVVKVQQALFELIDLGLYHSKVVTKMGLAEKTDAHKGSYAQIFALILKKHRKHWGVELVQDPIFQWAALTGTVVTYHIAENKPTRKIE